MTTVTLHNGKEVDSNSEEWRIECEARSLLRMPLNERRWFLEGVQDKRGPVACDVLKARMTAIWNKERGQ